MASTSRDPAWAHRGDVTVAMLDYGYDRERMVRRLAERGIRSEAVLEAMRKIPRHLFVRREHATRSYREFALPIGEGQTISQPLAVARMTELLELRADHSVLEIGTGSGYQTAILALLSRRVFSIERVAPLAQSAIARMRELDLQNVKIQVFDGTVGFSEAAPYERILVTAGAPSVPTPLLDQLAKRGRLVIPEGEAKEQRLVVYEKDHWGTVKRWQGEVVSFVPLLGRHGWQEGQ